MIGFFIKKAFFDGWDNLIGLVLFNIGYIVVMFGLFWLSLVVGQTNWAIGYVGLAISVVIVSILMGGTASVTHNYSNYQHDAWGAFKNGVKRNIRHSLLFSLILILFFANLLLGTNHELKNRYMHVDFADENASQSINSKVSKYQFDTFSPLTNPVSGHLILQKERKYDII